jgi:hypothetical protein
MGRRVPDAQAFYAARVGFHDLEADPAVVDDEFAPGRYASGEIDHEPGERVDVLLAFLVREDGAYPVLECVDFETRIGDQRAVGPLQDLRTRGDVVLVLDLAHDFLDQILDGDEAVDAAELVHNQRHVHARLAHLHEQVENGHGGRDEEDLARDARELETVLALRMGKHVLDVHKAHHVVECLAVDRDAGMPAPAHQLDQGVEVGVHGDRADIRARHHHIVRRVQP